MYGTRHTSAGCYPIDTYHTRLDQRLNAIARPISVRMSAHPRQALVPVARGNWGPRQPGRRPTGGHETYVIMLPGQAQTVRGHPGILHQCF